MTIQVLNEKQVPVRAIARQIGAAESTVRYHLSRQRSGATDGRKQKLFAAEEFAAVIEAWHREHGEDLRPVNLLELHQHLVRVHGYPHSYKSVQRFMRARYGRPAIRTYRRVETPPGAQVQSDWGVWPSIDIGNGPQRLSSFVMVLSHSRKPAVVWSEREDQVSWLHCHNRAFERLGGIPAVNRIDNPKTAIAVGAGAWGTIHPVYAAYARSVGFHVDACAPREPQQKGKTEAKVRLCRGLVAPKHERFDGIEHLQSETDHRVTSWSERTICPTTGKSVAESWAEERELLAPLPLLPEPFDVSVVRPVQRDCLVNFEQRQYSVPFTYVGREVEVRGCAGRVQIFFEGRLVRAYPRGTEQRLFVDPSCYEGTSTERVLAPPPLGKMGKRLAEIYAMPVATRPLDLYAALAEVAR